MIQNLSWDHLNIFFYYNTCIVSLRQSFVYIYIYIHLLSKIDGLVFARTLLCMLIYYFQFNFFFGLFINCGKFSPQKENRRRSLQFDSFIKIYSKTAAKWQLPTPAYVFIIFLIWCLNRSERKLKTSGKYLKSETYEPEKNKYLKNNYTVEKLRQCAVIRQVHGGICLQTL